KVAEACGYPDPYHFSRAFRKATGKSPRAFRQCREKAADPG
ncbi:MAG: helix-turn-helix transcriptional regulator, partial [Planctomycetes bacterium]|nr:helix-turn-helix transcriptional regulator [Planctomycetota bacterium]